MADFTGVLNPKRVIQKREESQEDIKPSTTPSPGQMSQSQFMKPFSAEEKARQNAQLAKILADRARK